MHEVYASPADIKHYVEQVFGPNFGARFVDMCVVTSCDVLGRPGDKEVREALRPMQPTYHTLFAGFK